MRIVWVHGDFGFRSIPENLARCERAVAQATTLNPDLILTPELATSGYGFFEEIGTDWMARELPLLLKHVRYLARHHNTAVLLGTPWWEPEKQASFNAALWIDENGDWKVVHRKVRVIHGSEGWATPGKTGQTLVWRGRRIGVFICADAYTPDIAAALTSDGAEVLLSPAAWCPGPYGPGGEWERRSAETGLPLLVCNRTGADPKIDFTGSMSGLFFQGERLLAYDEPAPALLALDVDPQTWRPRADTFSVYPLEP